MTHIKKKHKESMKNVDISSVVKNSEKFKKAIEEGRVGWRAHKDEKHTEETKNKIRESLLKYYEDNGDKNIGKHREAMAKSKGKKISQYNLNNEFIKEYNSISEAGRISGIKKSNIQHVLSGSNKTAGGYMWKYVDEKDLKPPLVI